MPPIWAAERTSATFGGGDQRRGLPALAFVICVALFPTIELKTNHVGPDALVRAGDRRSPFQGRLFPRALPGQSSRRRRPASYQLSQNHDLARMVAGVRRDRLKHFQLSFAPMLHEQIAIFGLAIEFIQSITKFFQRSLPFFGICGRRSLRPTVPGALGESRPFPIEPLHHPVLPINHVL